ncbi:hypothetical protein [uncultured Mycolicibacterium sp.]|uniref:hypothetical protein n=1 Tax=uncultured Mycolicibacterium sp. TaxID=2320817 RepID=UPI0026249375|nr:hypothetical protein [uncultured Mycolicibacterium sp.]
MSGSNGGGGGGLLGLLGLLVIIGVIIEYFWWIVGALVVLLIGWIAYSIHRGKERERQRVEKIRRRKHDRLIAAADRQHAWLLAGDSRGIYGEKGARYMSYVERDDWDGLIRLLAQERSARPRGM